MTCGARLAGAVASAVAVLVLAGAPADAARLGRNAAPQTEQAPAPRTDASPQVPRLTGPVVDTVQLLSPREHEAIEALAHELERKTGAEMAVVIVGTTAPLDIFDYGMRVAAAWKLGKQGRDDGLLMVVAVKDRKVRFFTGYGLEGVLPDGKLGAILDAEVTPRFRAGDYGAGIYAGLYAAAEAVGADAGVTLETGTRAPRPARQPRQPDNVELIWLLVYLSLFIVPFVLARASRRRRSFWPIFFGGGGFGGGFGGGGFGGGGFGGGGGGFGGGGRFGGGGAGRGW